MSTMAKRLRTESLKWRALDQHATADLLFDAAARIDALTPQAQVGAMAELVVAHPAAELVFVRGKLDGGAWYFPLTAEGLTDALALLDSLKPPTDGACPGCGGRLPIRWSTGDPKVTVVAAWCNTCKAYMPLPEATNG